MKKVISLFAIFTFLSLAVMPAFAGVPITTGLTQLQSGGDAPIVKAKWEMNTGMLGTDDSNDPGSQFMPTGVKDRDRVITICAIVTDPDGLADVDGVYADVYYPEGIDLGPSHVALPNQSGDGCGMFMQEDTLYPLDKLAGIELFCNKVRNGNNNLPVFNTGYNYDEICKTDGELWKETARVYCADKHLSYEDPSGMYKVTAVAQDANSLTGTLDNFFEYMPLTAFEVDFTSVDYGNVKLNTEKIINGDLVWDPATSTMPTIRNVGNSRMNLQVWQDDMGLGQTSGEWNVTFDARVGSVVPHQDYPPEFTATLEDALDLSELDEVDFSILVTKFPIDHGTTWIGNMILSAVSASHLICDPIKEMRHISLENKTENWEIISNDLIWGDIDYSHNDNTFNGLVTGQGLTPNSPYQITLNGPGNCTFTDDGLAGIGPTLFDSGYWNNNVNLDAVCLGTPGEGVYNMDLITDWYTVWTDASGNFSHNFNIALPAGDYVGVKVLVKKMLNPFVPPWADFGPGYPTFNLYETASIDFTVL